MNGAIHSLVLVQIKVESHNRTGCECGVRYCAISSPRASSWKKKGATADVTNSQLVRLKTCVNYVGTFCFPQQHSGMTYKEKEWGRQRWWGETLQRLKRCSLFYDGRRKTIWVSWWNFWQGTVLGNAGLPSCR